MVERCMRSTTASILSFKRSSLVVEDREIPKPFSIASNAGEHLIYSIDSIMSVKRQKFKFLSEGY